MPRPAQLSPFLSRGVLYAAVALVGMGVACSGNSNPVQTAAAGSGDGATSLASQLDAPAFPPSPAAAPFLPAPTPKVFNIAPQDIRQDPSVRYDYDIVYVRSPRYLPCPGCQKADLKPARWAEFSNPFAVTPGSDLVLLRPDGREEVLVAAGEGAVQEPYVSFDGQTVFYTLFHKADAGLNTAGADIYKMHVPTRNITRLTTQTWAANRDIPTGYGVYNMHPCPVPGGKVAYVSNRNALLPPPPSYPKVALQLHIMDEDGSNIDTIGHLNLGNALHPTILTDGRLIFSSLENMGLRNSLLWALWRINPDGTGWGPVVSALHSHGSPPGWHFQSQLSDGRIVVELYYNQNQKGFGTPFTVPLHPPAGRSAFGPGDVAEARNQGFAFVGSSGPEARFPFTPAGMEVVTRWTRGGADEPAFPSVLADAKSPYIGKVTHPVGAPDNHLFLIWSLGPIGGSAGAVQPFMGPTPIDSGIYLLKHGASTSDPGQMLLIKNDPAYNEQWARALVSYKRVYGMDEPQRIIKANDGKASAQLPEGTPFGLVGTSSLYKRESAPLGRVPVDSVTAVAHFPGEDRFLTFLGAPWNWEAQGSDAGRYENSAIYAIRILAFEPNVNTAAGRYGRPLFLNVPGERLRVLGEVPVRKGHGVLDTDGNPDTSFLAKIPADVAYTFQTIDQDGLMLNMAQTWHQLRPGEIRHDCGGCHAHSQAPTRFESTAAAQRDYPVPTLTGSTLVEYFRDIKPIFDSKCVSCHNKGQATPGELVFDDDSTIGELPGTYARLMFDEQGRYGPRRTRKWSEDVYIVYGSQSWQSASHWVWKHQARRSLLVWKLFGRRLDGFDNAFVPSDRWAANDPRRAKAQSSNQVRIPEGWPLYEGDVDYLEGTDHRPFVTDAQRRLIATWIDTGGTIDLGKGGKPSGIRDDTRPTLVVTWPAPGTQGPVTRVLLGMHDYGSDLDMATFSVTADVAIDGIPAGTNLASRFRALEGSRWEWTPSKPLSAITRATFTVKIRDKTGNVAETARTFSVR